MVNLGIGVIEQAVQQFMIVFAAKVWTNNILIFCHQATYVLDQRNRILCSYLYTLQHKEYPGFPFCGIISILVSDSLYQSVVLSFVVSDVSTKIEDGQVKQAGDYQIEYIDNATCAAITIIEWMDALELMVYDSHLD